MSALNFFLWCSGVDRSVIRYCHEHEQNKYAGIGGIIFFTALMAYVSSSFAIYKLFGNAYQALLFGFVWATMIFNLDRFIVSTMRKKDGQKHIWLQAIPRFLLGIIIAVVISKPLELFLFEKEINHIILQKKKEYQSNNRNITKAIFQPRIENNKAEIERLRKEVFDKEKQAVQLYESFIAEAEGTKGTGLRGKGPVYKDKREKYDQIMMELGQLRAKNYAEIERLNTANKELDSQLEQNINSDLPTITNIDGLMLRIDALKELPFWTSFFVQLLFLTLETAPIISKLITPRGQYDKYLEELEDNFELDLEEIRKSKVDFFNLYEYFSKLADEQIKTEEDLVEEIKNSKRVQIRAWKDLLAENQLNINGWVRQALGRNL